MKNKEKIAIALLVINMFIISSPIIKHFLSSYNTIFIANLLLSLLLLSWNHKFNKLNLTVLCFSILSMISFIGLSVFWEEWNLLHYPKYFILGLIAVSFLNEIQERYLAEIATKIIILNLIFCIIGFFYYSIGGQSIYDFEIAGGRKLYLYLTTFNITNYSSFIRPSGIYDEPGALSFYCCFIVYLRERFLMKRSVSLIVLVLGLISLSLAHVLFFILVLISFYFKRSMKFNKKQLRITIFVMLAVLLLVPLMGSELENAINFLFNRTTSGLTNDGRYSIMLRTIETIRSENISLLLFGVNPDCLINYHNCISTYGKVGENPLTMILFSGLFGSWSFYLVIVWSLILAIIFPSKHVITFSMLLLFLQRPYQYEMTYSLIFSIIVINLIKDSLFNNYSHNTILKRT
ncbi:hypothetical protein A6E01_17255 [Vibrio breoganii]|uniref:O-antigen ligase domain-containing protein n=1 Tax=Vibrio breoganii TaxID=553239 RepID=A0AAN0XYD5_9VIBR|nr:hypothetical protein [Vibrio breoganii]ANO34931.1 hypothetical protein A6E01_17255 [Vibrio breoganii]